ncbi:putative glucose-methanol-choline oxidoreductase protein [Botrytis fragariae]|uniref:Putative glucose-methanol-choline oxidoreductase protein n=1 Tax=Botrytis fragariae TaxID=1964551 RepID=A0A8H6AID9_9HELO|nr:putative glucose-methanol-choline oxidoreductase protein [Botrytis fragariae]KAF5867861.1 putative glucose-methanol-choline oxidoreductase protein [Botrytis fragariae]
MTSQNFDIIIVGGGTAGCVLANRLSESERYRILLIESGEDLTSDPRTNVPSLGALLMATDANWGFSTVPQVNIGNRTNSASAGRLLGGSSAINGFAFLPNSKLSIETWANLGNPGWDAEAFSKSMNRFTLATSASTNNPAKSPLQITIPEEDTEWPRVWRDTLATLGFPPAQDALTSGNVLGSVMGGETIGLDKKRSHSAKAYLDETVRSRGNLTIWTKVTAERILFENSDSGTPTAVGVTVRNNETGTSNSVLANKEVILCGGAINSPRLLELSGVGDTKILESLGIDVMVNNPNVGEHLQNHPLVTVTFEARDEEGFDTIDQILRKDKEAISKVQAAYAKGVGPGSKSNLNVLAQLPVEVDDQLKQALDKMLPQHSDTSASLVKSHEAFVRAVVTSPKEASACYMTVPGFMCLSGAGSFVPPEPGSEKYFTMGIHLAHPLSRGSVHIKSSSTPLSSSDVSIDPNFFSHPFDVEILARHIQLAEKIAMTEPLSNHLKPDGKRSPGMPKAGGFADITIAKNYVLERAAGAHHWTGSCAMMPEELGGVVDSQLRVFGCANLRVCDASIMPISPRSNPQGVVYAIAEHAAGIILSTLQ